jgi:pimeloyl-ACP methyl ester carboxylesterase
MTSTRSFAARCASLALIASLSLAPVPSFLGSVALQAEPPAQKPGDLVETINLPNIDPVIRDTGAQSVRLRYRSTSAWNKAPVIVSAAAFIPAGQPPAGGWPIIGFGHGTTGVREGCGPSLSPNLLGGASMIAALLKNGYAVVLTDYEGLGEPGVHAYLDAQAAGLNIIDSVRALRQVRPSVLSNRWLAVGGSQGGAAVWAANEEAGARAPELQLIGVVALVPAADFSAYADLAAAGTLGPFQRAAYAGMLYSFGRGTPPLNVDLYRRGSATRNWDTLNDCHAGQARDDALAQLTNEELKPASPAATRQLKARLEKMALPKARDTAPMLVIYAGRDEFLDPAWTRAAIESACKMGSQIEADFQSDKGHGGVDIASAVPWIARRFAGGPVAAKCG